MELVQAEMMDITMHQSSKGWVVYMCSREETVPTSLGEEASPRLSALCEEFAVIFEEPMDLPPQRSHDHHIPLVQGAEPVNLRLYRHL